MVEVTKMFLQCTTKLIMKCLEPEKMHQKASAPLWDRVVPLEMAIQWERNKILTKLSYFQERIILLCHGFMFLFLCDFVPGMYAVPRPLLWSTATLSL